MTTASDNEATPWDAPFIVHTRRMRLGPCTQDAAAKLAEIIADPQVYEPFYVGRPQPRTLQADAANWLQTEIGWSHMQQFNLLATLLDSGEVVGCVQFTPGQIGYFVAPRFWRQALGREMVAASCDHIPYLLGITLLETSVMRENIGSRRILEQCGFDFVGLSKMHLTGRAGQVAMLRYQKHCA